jgi:FtsH-binding integral membrane protein
VRKCETGKVILESAILTAVVVVSLTLYTFWAAKRGHDFSFLAPILFAGFMVLLVFILIQVLLILSINTDSVISLDVLGIEFVCLF